MRALHFGAGSLGLGLVVPTLVGGSYEVSVVDADPNLAASLEAQGGYLHDIHEDGQIIRTHIPIRRALAASDREAVARALGEADLITTSVRLENLPRVAPALSEALGDREGGPFVIACENAPRASSHLAGLCGRLGDPRFLDATVDRICQTAWPQEPRVRSERHLEWTVERRPTGAPDGIPGLSVVDDIEPSFERKRYLVNTTADAVAFLGTAGGHATLAAAASDERVLDRCRHAFSELRAVLGTRFGLAEAALEAYHRAAIARLAAPGIERSLETVARDLLRKLGPDERFVDPARRLLDTHVPPVGLSGLIAALIDLGGLDHRAVFATWGREPWADRLATLVSDASRTVADA